MIAFDGIKGISLVRLFRIYPELNPCLVYEALKTESKFKDFRVVTERIFNEAIQHIDIGLAYLDLGLVDGPRLIEQFL